VLVVLVDERGRERVANVNGPEYVEPIAVTFRWMRDGEADRILSIPVRVFKPTGRVRFGLSARGVSMVEVWKC